MNAMLLRREVLQHLIDPKRDIDKECGYPVDPSIDDYRLLYDREGIATRVVDVFPEESWADDPEVLEEQGGDFTDWEETWNDLVDEFNIYDELLRVDCISGIGSFGILLIGIDDGKALNLPVDGIDLRTGKRATENAPERNLLYLRPLDQSVVTISQFESDRTHPRYGQPVMYQVNMSNDKNGATAAVGTATASTPELQSMDVHWTRVIHVADNRKNSRVFGVPRMKRVFNRLYDLRKLLGGAGEMFWKGGFPGLAFETQPDAAAQGPLTKEEKKTLREEISDYQNGMQRFLALSGMTAKSLAPQVADPSNHFETNIKSICTSLGVPYRIFMGTEEAQLAGAQDKKAWNKRLQKRRTKYVEKGILRPFVDRLIAMGVLAPVERYQVYWPDLETPDAKTKADVAAAFTRALAAYVSGGVDTMILPLDYLTNFCGMDTETATDLLERAVGNVDEKLPDDEPDPADGDPNADPEDTNTPPPKRPKPTRNYGGKAKKKKKVNGGAY